MRKILERAARHFTRDDGVAGLVIAMIIAIVAATALAVYFRNFAGPARQLQLLTRAGSHETVLKSAIFSYFLQQSPSIIPCPDTDQDGDQDCTDTSGTASGTLPWLTLGLSREDVIDPYGRFYTYVALADTEAREVCVNQQNDYNTSEVEYTGSTKDQTSLEIRLTSQSAGEGRYVPFAIISHGANGLGGISASGTATAAAASGSFEETNADDAGPSVVYSGPYDASSFDDVVFAPTAAEVQKVCEGLSPGQAKNAALSEDFNDSATSVDSTKFTSSSTAPPTQSAGRAQFSANTSYLATATSYDFTPNVQPVYVAAYWTPSASNSGFSIATRATPAPTGDIFTTGLTFRFDDRDGSTSGASPGVTNSISIRNSSGVVTTTGDATYDIITGQEYLLEVYDNGNNVWMRVTQVSAPANAATIQGTDTTDLSGEQRVVFINGDGASSLDNVVIGVPMLSLQTGPSSGYAATASSANGTTTGNITLEAWIKPRSLPTGTNEATIISQWETSDEDNSSFRLYLLGGTFTLDLNDTAGTGDAETISLGFGPTANEWMHIAVSYDRSSNAIRAYQDGALAFSGTSNLDSNGIRPAGYSFAVGADTVNTPPANFFYGNISDVRVWDDVRTATEIARCYQKRLPAAAPCNTSNLVVNWKLDPTVQQGALSEADALTTSGIGTAGTLSSASYGPAIAAYFRPTSTDFCPGPGDLGTGSQGTRVGAYQCDFRVQSTTTTATTWDIDIPTNLNAITAKIWGGGGGGYDPGSRNGGHGGFSLGVIEQINGVDIAGMNISLLVGGGGTGSSTAGTGAGGGAGSLIADLADHISLISGGGGGASYSDSGSVSCNGTARCGDGADGAGAGSTTSTAIDGTSTCGGRGGSAGTFLNDPPTGGSCPDGGADPTGSTTTGGRGGAGTSGSLGGTGTIGTLIVSGGRGYQPQDTSGSPNVSAVGAGGGGGGYVGGEAGGFDDNAATTGYGGGGGSGNAASGVSGVVTGTAFSDNACTADKTNNFPDITITSCTSGGTDLVARGWTVGMSFAGAGIPAGTTILSISGATLVMSADATNGSSVTVTVTGTIGGPSATGTSDFDYSPSYLATGFTNPGNGGTSGSNGNPGAIVLRW